MYLFLFQLRPILALYLVKLMTRSDLSDEQENSNEDRCLPRNPFIDDEAIEGECSNSSGDESCIIQPMPAKRRRPLVSYSDSD